MTHPETLPLPKGHYWGDLFIDPEDQSLLLPLRDRKPAILRVRPDLSMQIEAVRLTLPGARLQLAHPAGCWLVTTPRHPMSLFAVDRSTGATRWEHQLTSRFDPDARLTCAIDSDGSILLAGCGIPAARRLSDTGALLLDYYALESRHALDFAWRGVRCIVPGEAGRVCLIDRYMFGIVLVIDPALGHIADWGVRGRAPMSPAPDGWADPAWGLPDGAGGMWLLEQGRPCWTHLSREGRVVQQLPLDAPPWHYLEQVQGCRSQASLVTVAINPNRLYFKPIPVRD
ncbi:MAG: hypothetical protein GEEBNDBF_01651 [bacterium]|nr:hypothetical protein [bacterium]